ncbi:SGNH/GDSL hydrolase family protein [Streptomyces sp. NPDC008313]|uniref:SGNH/GDSL hydrolase family protein n=1 Tax=Streptomyces sp. NPDC008313 TaxID=3364826 RepID=UPI0036E5B884
MSSSTQTVSAWGPSMVPFGRSFADQTVRMVIHPTASGPGARLRVSNLHGPGELTVGAVGVAGPSGPFRPVTFGHAPKTVLGRGQEVYSDVLPVDVVRGQALLVSVHLPEETGPSTHHREALRTCWVSPPGSGDLTAREGLAGFTGAESSWYFLSGLTVEASDADGTVVAFGDSITDGANTTPDTNRRWPDLLARRLASHRTAVVNAGVAGNRLLSDSTAVACVHRFGHDVLGHAGVRTVVVLAGINDILTGVGADGSGLTAGDLIDGYRCLTDMARAGGVRIVGGTLLPSRNLTAGQDTVRLAVNDWILGGDGFDGVVDFAAATADPGVPGSLRPAYDSGDGLHPNDAGMAALAGAVDPAVLTGPARP